MGLFYMEFNKHMAEYDFIQDLFCGSYNPRFSTLLTMLGSWNLLGIIV